MRIDFYTNVYPVSQPNQYNQAFEGYVYKPNGRKFINKINPLMRYADDVFSRSLNASRRNIQTPAREIEPFTEEIRLLDSYAWDINPDERRKYIIILHGFSQNISNLQDLYKSIIKKTNYAILAPEYRGFGKNKPAELSADTLLEDTLAAVDYLKGEYDINPEDITILGHSFGGCVASLLASNLPDIERLILVSSLDTLDNKSLRVKKAFKNKISAIIKFLYNHLNFLMYPITNSLSTSKYLKKIKAPVDIIYSDYDKMIKPSVHKKLIKACKNLSSINVVPTGGHKMDQVKIHTITDILNR